MIDDKIPKDWRELQVETARVLNECGFDTELEHKVLTVRGRVEVDVLATDITVSPRLTYMCECKHWSRAVPQEVIHSFRTVVGDYGANTGIIISKQGFQSGAVEASKNTNVLLVDWFGFQDLFIEPVAVFYAETVSQVGYLTNFSESRSDAPTSLNP